MGLAAGAGSLLLAGYEAQAYLCRLDQPGQAALVVPVSGRVRAAWFDPEQGLWQLLTDQGRLWHVSLRDGAMQIQP